MAESTPQAAPGGLEVGTITPAPAPLPQASTPISQEESSTPFGPTTGIAHPIPIPKKAAEWESGYQNEHGPRPSRWDSWVATPFEQGMHNTIASPWGGALVRMLQEDQSKSGQMISADDANTQYPGRPVPYTTPVDRATAVLEYNDRQKQQALSDWAAQRPVTTMGRVTSFASGFVGGMTDPLNFAIGAMSGGVSDLLAPEAAGLAGKVAAHYLANLGGFSVTDALQNLAEHQMGAKRKQLSQIVGENVVPAAVMTGVGIGLGALSRRFLNEGGGTSEGDLAGVKKTVAAFEQDRRPPLLEDQRSVLAQRRQAPQSDGPRGPIQTSPLYAAAHSDGTPLVHEHGLGGGIQLTDSHEVANNGVSRSTETPGQIAEAKLPENTKLLNIDQSASQAPELLKAIEEKTGVSLEGATQNGESLKDLITNLGDWAGTDLGKGKSIPENILAQVQEIAKAQGYAGYEFAGQNSRQAHLFDSASLEVSNAHSADPSTTPALPETPANSPETNPAIDKAQEKFYSPEMEKLVHEYRKGKVFDPSSPEALLDAQKDIELYKQQLSDLSKTSETAKSAYDDLRAQEAQDQRLRDIARRIAECGQGGGL